MRYVSANVSYGLKATGPTATGAAFGERLRVWIAERSDRVRDQTDGHIDCKVSDCLEVLYTNDHDVDCISIFSDHRECKEEGYNVGGTQLNRQAFVS